MARSLNRRIEALEQALMPVRHGPAFIMASSHAEADREIERLCAEYPDSMSAPPFVMILAKPETGGEGDEHQLAPSA